MTFTQLEYVLAVVKHGHFGRAARACRVTQPTLSQQVRKVEDDLELSIFDRSRSPIAPTEAGWKIVRRIEAVLAERQNLDDLVGSLRGDLTGDFRLGMSSTLAQTLLPAFLGPFERKHPDARLLLEERPEEELARLLLAGVLDAAILASPAPCGGLVEETLFEEPLYALVGPGHRLAGRVSIGAGELRAAELLLEAGPSCHAEPLCGRERCEPCGARRLGRNVMTLKNLVLAGIGGVTVLPHLAIRLLGAGERQLVKPITPRAPTRTIRLVWSKTSARGAIMRALVQVIRAALPPELRGPRSMASPASGLRVAVSTVSSGRRVRTQT